MAHIIRRSTLSRRALLRGAGASLALPWLDAMAGALSPRPAPNRRFVFVFAPNGIKMDDWTPDPNAGPNAPLPHLLQPFADLRRDVLTVSGLAIDAGRAHGDGPGDHARAAATWLTCAHPVKTAGADIRAGTSIDQVIAHTVGAASRFSSLELGMEKGRSTGSCDSGYSCAYSSSISWRTPTTPNAKEVRPRALFARLFGDPARARSAAEAAQRRSDLASVLDATGEEAARLRRQLGNADRSRLDEYLTAVRELETRLARSETASNERAAPPGLLDRLGDGHGYVDRLRLMYDMIAIALETEATRVVSFMVGNAGSNRSYRWLGVREGHHGLSHHRGDAGKIAQIRKINRFHTEELARFVTRLGATPDGGGRLLDATVVVWGSGLSDGNRHRHDDLPVLIAGRGVGLVRPGRHLVVPQRTPMANLYLALAAGAGAPVTRFADSTGRLAELA